jgi:mannose-6-phosphate isomerase-like protein (cupin superfamily)
MERKDIMDSNKFGRQEIPNKTTATKHIEKYWGKITTIESNDKFVLKHIFMKSGTQSSMEYHVEKEEWYYVLSGKLKVGMRIGRAKNKSVILSEGDIIHIPKGLMHMRIALEDTVIVEWSNVDNDLDSNIVEDGMIYEYKETLE